MPESDARSVDAALGQHLISSGAISNEELVECLAEQGRLGGALRVRLGRILIERRLVESQVVEALYGRIGAGESLSTASGRVPATVMEIDPGGGTPQSGSSSGDEIPAEVAAVVDDPARRIGRHVILAELGRGGMGVVYQG